MDDKTLRSWGVAVGAGAMVVAGGVAALGGRGGESDGNGPIVSADQIGAAAPEFIVRFKPSHKLGAAQDLAAQGKLEAAAAAARAGLAASPELKDLCFERFTLGGVETVLRLCATPSSPGASASASERWIRRLRADANVEYADANVTVDMNAQP